MRGASVFLVGAGPGDPELLTVKAQRLIREADVVVYDRLVSPEILATIPPGTTRIYAGKSTGNHPVPQDEINALLVALARSGRRVVRLKGGDPYVFGRGSEEAAYLARHGVLFETVPGITAAAGCAARAGIPLTHRGLASGVRYIAGQCRAEATPDLDWQGLADADTTLVVYMGLGNLSGICRELMAAGLPGDTPAAAVAEGTTPRETVCRATLESLPARVAEDGLAPPVIVIIGRVVALASLLHCQPSFGDREEGEGDALGQAARA